jgi:hypothetical protein
MRCTKLLAVAAFGVSSVINPGYFAGCASNDHEDEEGSNQAMTAEMTERVLAANSSYDLNIDAVDYRIDVDIEPVRESAKQALNLGSAFAQTAHACGTKKLMATAAACITEYQMDVTGHITLLRKATGDNYSAVASDVAVTGTLSSFGPLSLKFDGGQVELEGQLGAEYSYNLGSYTLQTLIAE